MVNVEESDHSELELPSKKIVWKTRLLVKSMAVLNRFLDLMPHETKFVGIAKVHEITTADDFPGFDILTVYCPNLNLFLQVPVNKAKFAEGDFFNVYKIYNKQLTVDSASAGGFQRFFIRSYEKNSNQPKQVGTKLHCYPVDINP